MASATSACMRSISAALGGRRSKPITATRTAPCATRGMKFRLSGLLSRCRRKSAADRHSHERLEAMKELESRSRSSRSGSTGNGAKPQFPPTSVVTPWEIRLSPRGKVGSEKSECVWASMKPGARHRSPASSSRVARAPFKSPMAAMRPSRIPTSPRNQGVPEPSMILACPIRQSSISVPPHGITSSSAAAGPANRGSRLPPGSRPGRSG